MSYGYACTLSHVQRDALSATEHAQIAYYGVMTVRLTGSAAACRL